MTEGRKEHFVALKDINSKPCYDQAKQNIFNNVRSKFYQKII